jgi:hypothetical protein
MNRVLVAAALFASSGCARNAFLELTIQLPKNHDTMNKRYAVTQVMAGPDFKVQWADDNAIAAVLLDANNPSTQKLSIEGNSDNESQKLGVKITFCKDPNCLALGDEKAPTTGLEIERAFYIGKRTNFTWTIDCIPPGDGVAPVTGCTPELPKVVEKCKVGGCVGGPPTSNYCIGGKHRCEDD